ncbi:uncharacterized protein [Lepidochelys kempii]|uniref:uncharacterized protein isoform X7 n=1 Tax=Lepidochelys kempii TaxID=8472 RepID=UPI003C6FA52D
MTVKKQTAREGVPVSYLAERKAGSPPESVGPLWEKREKPPKPRSSGKARSCWEDGAFRKPEPGFAELERRLSDFSLTSAVLQQVLRGFKETLRRELGSDTGCRMTSPGPSRFSQPARGWEMGMAELAQGPVTFEEVAVYFTREDWWTPLREPSPETSCRRPTRT